MSKKPIIGISGDLRAAKKNVSPISWYQTGYYDSVTAAGGIPALIPPLAEDADLKQYMKHLDGLVLSGCRFDLNPIRLGFDPHPATRSMPQRREDFDRRLCKMALEMRMPILGVGVGMQMMNVIAGGSLHQHIPEDITKPLFHRDAVETNLRHIIDIVPGTRVDRIYGPGEIRVNSQHHMAVNQVANIFRVSATAPDGVVEAFESIDEDWFCLGIQWHPENETASALDMQVFEIFLDACSDVEPATVPMYRQAA